MVTGQLRADGGVASRAAAVLPSPAGRNAQFAILFGINALYIGFGMAGGIIQGALPPILRAQGYGVASAGWPFLLYLPFGLSFLWGVAVDRFSLPFLTPRIGWIVAMQAIALAMIVVVAIAEALPIGALLAIGLVATFAIATMDVALDALAVDTVAPDRRPLAAALKLAALSLGAIIGGGFFVVLFEWVGWRSMFFLLALFMAALTVPIGLLLPHDRRHKRQRLDDKPDAEVKRASLLRLIGDARSRNRLLLLTLACCVIFPLAGLNRLMLLDIGVPLERIGWIVGTLGPLAMLATSMIAIPMMARLGFAGTLFAFSASSVATLAAMMAGYVWRQQELAIVGTVLIGAGVSGIFVVLATRIIGWAAGDQPATDYSAYYGISRFFSTVLTIVAAQAVPAMGWAGFYGLGIVAVLFVTVLLRATVFRRS